MATDVEKMRLGWIGKDVHVETVTGKDLDGLLDGSHGDYFALKSERGLLLVRWAAVVTMEVVATRPQEYNAHAFEKPKP